MLLNIEQISQPYSGEYEEIIFDIESNWNSSDCLGSDLKKILQFGVVNSEVNILVLHSPYRKG